MKLTDLEARILNIIWDAGNRASVQHVLDKWDDNERPQYTTVLKILQILEKKGAVTHEKQGRSYQYIPLISKSEAVRSNLTDMVRTFFNEDKVAFAQTFLSKNEFSLNEIKAMKKMIEDKEQGMTQ